MRKNIDESQRYMCSIRKASYRRNPMTAVQSFAEMIDDLGIPDWEAYEYAKDFYSDSLTDPDKFLEEHTERMGYRYIHGRNFTFVGPRGRLLKVYASEVEPLEGNIFDFQKLKGLAVAPDFTDFKIPLFVGYAAPWNMSPSIYEEKTEYEDEFYEPTEEDIGEIFFQVRDGNHRTIATLLSGEPYTYVQIYDNTYQDYQSWVGAGRPNTWPGGTKVFKYLDENLL